MTTLAPAPVKAPASARPARRIGKIYQIAGLLIVWLALWQLFWGKLTLASGGPQFVISWLYNFREWVDDGRLTNPLFVYVFMPFTKALGSVIDAFTWVTVQLGPPGVIAIATAIALLVAGWRMAVLTGIGFAMFGMFGLWDASMQTLVLIVVSVIFSLIVGIPLGVWAGRSDRFNRFITPILDTMQIMPSFAYLPIITLFFLIGAPAGVIATIVYAIPPAIRLTSVGIRNVPSESVEAAVSLGATTRQVLFGVQLPMARSTIAVGVNQTIMAALSMVVIAALIAAPGLGMVVIDGLKLQNVGMAFNAGMAIVVMAIVLDRVVTAISRRQPSDADNRRDRIVGRFAAGAIVVIGLLIPIVLPVTAKWAGSRHPLLEGWANSFADWLEKVAGPYTEQFTRDFTLWILNPLESVLTNTPFIVTMGGFITLGLIMAARPSARARTAVTAGLCLAGIILLGCWPSAMETLAQVILAVAITIVVGIVLGVWIGRSIWADRIVRPVLDALQVMPPFVYLVPCLALFGPTRFTAIFAAILYAAPAVIKIVGEGIRGVPKDTIEASRSVGTSRMQEIITVQLPMSRSMLLVALNQGIVFVMAMVVVGGLVGGGGLGYDVVKGFSQPKFAGLGLAAGLAIVLLGVMLDRLTQSAGSSQRTAHGLNR